jgi:hypothetical protein
MPDLDVLERDGARHRGHLRREPGALVGRHPAIDHGLTAAVSSVV